MRFYTVLAALIVAAFGWEPRISPPANQLDRIATGTDLYLVCQVSEEEIGDDVSDYSVAWYNNDERIIRQKARKNGYIQASLAFVKPNTSDNGKYTCKATVGDETKETSVDIVFYERAGFVNVQEVQHPEEGDDARVNCETKGDRLDEIFWRKNDLILDESDVRGYHFENDYHTLIIPKFTGEKDDANYSCSVVQFAQVYTQSFALTAYARPVITVFDEPADNSGKEGQNAVFKCQAAGKPSPVYKWFKHEENGGQTELNASDKYTLANGLLEINYLTESDAGEYSCYAENELGNATRASQLKILRKPRIFGMVDTTVLLGDEVTLTCTIESDSEVNEAYFMFNKEKLLPIPQYEPSTTTDASTSTSTADYEIVETSTDAETTTEEFEVEATTTEESAYSDDEDTATEEISAEDPVVNRRRRHTVQWNDEKTIQLTVNDIQMANTGKYSCYAHNVAGESHESAHVYIAHKPVFTNTSATSVRHKEGDAAEIYCEVNAVPAAELELLYNGQTFYANGASVTQVKTDNKISVTFSKLSDSDFGKYTCTAKNSQGEADPINFNIIHVIPPKNPEVITCTESVYPHKAVCHVEGYGNEVTGDWPLTFEVFYVQTSEEPAEDFNWDVEAKAFEVPFNGETIEVPHLTPTTKYYARFRPVNEAGTGDFTPVSIIETSNAWTPDVVPNVVIDCPDVCVINWTEPDHRGSPITGYRLKFTPTGSVVDDVSTTPLTIEITGESTEVEDSDYEASTVSTEEEVVPTEEADVSTEDATPVVGEVITIDVGADVHSVSAPQLLPLQNYVLEVTAVNDVGESNAEKTFFRTTEKSGLSSLFPTDWTVIGIFLVLAVILAAALDLFCCKTKQCGVLACIFNARGNRAPKDVEAGTGERLLKNGDRSEF
uniref:Ig-like domain-containing protein n=1 Tax=Panagrellus redivivus TaxID=6233 RepID=A0A7E4VRS3_PANRE